MTFDEMRRNILKGGAAIFGSMFVPRGNAWGAEDWYKRGGKGFLNSPEDAERFNHYAEYQNYGEVSDRFAIWRPYEANLYLPYLAVIKAEGLEKNLNGSWEYLTRHVNPWPESQTVGDCVSHFVRAASDVARATDVYGNGEDERWGTRTATEPIYGHRGHRGHGASCDRLVDYVTRVGGMMLRQDYPELGLDLSKYKASIGTNWGSSGVPSKVKDEGKKHQILKAVRVTDREQMRNAFRNGLAVGGCSYLAFGRTRNEDGVSKVGGSWAHAMLETGYDEREITKAKYGEPLVLVQNSWGAWNSGPRKILGTDILIPKGSAWIKESDYVKIKIDRGDCYTFVGANGWDVLRLTDFGFRAFG